MKCESGYFRRWCRRGLARPLPTARAAAHGDSQQASVVETNTRAVIPGLLKWSHDFHGGVRLQTFLLRPPTELTARSFGASQRLVSKLA